MKKIIENAPEVANAFFELTNTITLHNEKFDPKIKELILIGMFIAAGEYKGVKTHMERAICAGATRDELIGVALYAIPVVGVGKVNKALDEMYEVLLEKGQ